MVLYRLDKDQYQVIGFQTHKDFGFVCVLRDDVLNIYNFMAPLIYWQNC